MKSRALRILLVLFLFTFTVSLSCCGLGILSTALSSLNQSSVYVQVPMPYQLPARPGAVTFRLAMLHDVIHERYPKHGPAFYRERERLAREKLKTLPPESDEALSLIDDIGAGLDRLGNPAAAVPLLRDKLARQQKKGYTDKQLYTSYANLGTFFVHANMKAMLSGDVEARKQVREGLDFVKKSIGVNPDAHFGREKWQLAIGEYIVKCSEKPELFTTQDCLDNPLGESIEPRGMFRPLAEVVYRLSEETDIAKITNHKKIRDFRRRITTLESLRQPPTEYVSREQEETPFDEPMLGIIGMWRQGGGANPYFCLAIGETMFRVNQKHIAWSAYERASRLATKYGSQPEHAEYLRRHCQSRQNEIERFMKPAESKDLRSRFEAELTHGETYQRAYQEFEEQKIAAGGNIQDERFFADFHKDHPPIATPVGDEDWFEYASTNLVLNHRLVAFAYGMSLGGVLGAILFLWLQRKNANSRKARAASLDGFTPGDDPPTLRVTPP